MLDAFEICRERNDIDIVVITGIGDKTLQWRIKMLKVQGDILVMMEFRTKCSRLTQKNKELPKPVIAMVNGYAIGGGHVLHVVCDLTIASDNAIFGQTGPKVGSFDGGFGSSYTRHVGQKKAREIWLCKQYWLKRH